MIVQIGRKVLEAACREAAAWNTGRDPDRLVEVSVNISPRQFREPGLVESVELALAGSGLDPGLLYLEITETLMVVDEARVTRSLRQLKAHGVRLAVDDFGTGYSSLGSLRQFPVDFVKIDRVFVSGIEHNPQDAVVLAGIIDLAHAMKLRVVAEGVETRGERDRLQSMGCDLAQGYLFARPMPAGDAASLLREHR
jgi:EAL domain-containing protein (putative c-di-GMP-specific phosphodiesterase class I)